MSLPRAPQVWLGHLGGHGDTREDMGTLPGDMGTPGLEGKCPCPEPLRSAWDRGGHLGGHRGQGDTAWGTWGHCQGTGGHWQGGHEDTREDIGTLGDVKLCPLLSPPHLCPLLGPGVPERVAVSPGPQ